MVAADVGPRHTSIRIHQRLLPFARTVEGRKHGSTPSVEHFAPEGSETTAADWRRSSGFRLAPSAVSVHRGCHHDHPARDRYRLASSRFSSLVALEIPQSW